MKTEFCFDLGVKYLTYLVLRRKAQNTQFKKKVISSSFLKLHFDFSFCFYRISLSVIMILFIAQKITKTATLMKALSQMKDAMGVDG